MYEFLRVTGKFVIDPINQLAFFCILLFLLAYFRSKFVRAVALLVLLHVLFFSSKFGLFLTLKSLEEAHDLPRNAEPLDAVVVLSGGTVQYNPVESVYAWLGSDARILEAIRLYKASKSKLFVITGDTPGYSGPLQNEADSMRKLALEWGIPEENIVVEPKAQTTAEHAIELRPIFFEKNISSFYLVTSAYHMMRSVGVFEKAGYHPVPFPVGKIYERTNSWFNSEYYLTQALAIKEWIGLVVYKMRGAI
jgi:uncharacterized SAM-binding protein YcdF (DUF218 family)